MKMNVKGKNTDGNKKKKSPFSKKRKKKKNQIYISYHFVESILRSP